MKQGIINILILYGIIQIALGATIYSIYQYGGFWEAVGAGCTTTFLTLYGSYYLIENENKKRNKK